MDDVANQYAMTDDQRRAQIAKNIDEADTAALVHVAAHLVDSTTAEQRATTLAVLDAIASTPTEALGDAIEADRYGNPLYIYSPTRLTWSRVKDAADDAGFLAAYIRKLEQADGRPAD